MGNKYKVNKLGVVMMFLVFICLFLLTLNYTILSLEATEATEGVLVTGGVGFIGFHSALKLQEEHHVIVLDDFSSEYSDVMKLRAKHLRDRKITVHKGSVCDQPLLTHLFREHQFKAVIHAVSYSGNDVSLKSSIKSSIECLATLLEVLKDFKDTLLIFVSSDNVYNNSPLPFSPSNLIKFSLSNVDAALKIAGEEMVSTYCEIYELRVVIVRPFGVYGPYSRPNTIIYDMAMQLYQGETVNVLYKGSVPISRDFTYIDDIVNGIILALDYTPQNCHEVYNLGTGESISVDKVLELLEKGLQKKAKITHAPLSGNEPEVTQADISLSQTFLTYSALTSIEEGIIKFTHWFKDFKTYNSKSSFVPDHSLSDKVAKDHFNYKNKAVVDRIHNLREKYEEYAEKNHFEVSKLYREKRFTEYRGYTFSSGANQKTKNSQHLHDLCMIFDECMAYDSNGVIRGIVQPQSTWRRTSGSVFVADVDVCKAGVHNCFGNSTCKYAGPGQFECACPEGWGLYHTHDCVELYREGHKSQAEIKEEIADKIDGLDWNKFVGNADFYPFKGKTLKEDFLVYYPAAKGNVAMLTEACRKSYHCLGFTTDGALRSSIDIRKWKDDSSVTLYARDVDYCSLHEVKCKSGQRCRRQSPGNYACV